MMSTSLETIRLAATSSTDVIVVSTSGHTYYIQYNTIRYSMIRYEMMLCYDAAMIHDMM